MEDDRFLIGRGDHCDLQIDEETVSWDHLEIVCRGMSFFAVDLNSRNGTLLNGGRLIEERKLANSDVLLVGSHRLELDLPRRTGTVPGDGLDIALEGDELAVARALVAPLRQANSFAGRPATRAEIAKALHISESSVKRRIDSLSVKLGVPSDAKRERPRLVADRVIALGLDRRSS